MTSAAIRQEREQVLKELAGLEQIRRGSVTEQHIQTVGPDGIQRTRGPYPLYTFKEDGQTFSRRLHDTAADRRLSTADPALAPLQRAGGSIAGSGGTTQRSGRSGAGSKKNAECQIEKELEATRIVERLTGECHPDLEAWETAVLEAALKAGSHVLATALRGIGCGRREKPVLCACGRPMQSVGLRTKATTTLLGAVPFERSLYICPVCEDAACFPGDQLLGIEHTSFSPGVRRLMARAGSRTPFGEAHDDLKVYAHIDVEARDIERIAEQVGRQIAVWRARQDQALLKGRQGPSSAPRIPILYVSFDGTCIPMRKAELEGRRGKQPDGKAKGREVKLGCVFTQTKLDEQGRPLRDPDSTTYVGAIEASGPFGERMYAEALRRGLLQAVRVVVLNLASRILGRPCGNCPGCGSSALVMSPCWPRPLPTSRPMKEPATRPPVGCRWA